MNISYFQDSDTLHLWFRRGMPHETRQLDANTSLDLDASGNLVSMRIVNAREHAGLPNFSFEQFAERPDADFLRLAAQQMSRGLEDEEVEYSLDDLKERWK